MYSDVKLESLQYLEGTFLKMIPFAYCCKVSVAQKPECYAENVWQGYLWYLCPKELADWLLKIVHSFGRRGGGG